MFLTQHLRLPQLGLRDSVTCSPRQHAAGCRRGGSALLLPLLKGYGPPLVDHPPPFVTPECRKLYRPAGTASSQGDAPRRPRRQRGVGVGVCWERDGKGHLLPRAHPTSFFSFLATMSGIPLDAVG